MGNLTGQKLKAFSHAESCTLGHNFCSFDEGGVCVRVGLGLGISDVKGLGWYDDLFHHKVIVLTRKMIVGGEF
jgi:hypothetical protein